MIQWLFKYFCEVRALRDAKYNCTTEQMQKTSAETKTEAEKTKEKKAEKAANKRKKLMEKMCKMQRDFIKENPALYEATTGSGKEDGAESERYNHNTKFLNGCFKINLKSDYLPWFLSKKKLL